MTRSVIQKLMVAVAMIFFMELTAYAGSRSGAQTGDAMMNMEMMSTGLMLPRMDAVEGRKLFGSKGCVVCHSVNGVGGEDAPMLDAEFMEVPMNPFEFAAKMWRGAAAMVEMQNNEMGGQIEFSGQELADIIAFVHDPAEQAKFTEDDIPDDIARMMHELE